MAPAGARLTCTAAGLGAGGVGTAGGAEATRWAGVDAVGAAGGVGATRLAGVGTGVDAEIEVGNLKFARFLRTLSRVLTFIGGFCTMVARAAASCSSCPDPIRRNRCQISDRPTCWKSSRTKIRLSPVWKRSHR